MFSISHVFFSDDALDPLLTIVKDTKVDPDYLAKRLKSNIKDALLKEFLSMWKMQNFDVHLAVLEAARKHTAGQDKAWYVFDLELAK